MNKLNTGFSRLRNEHLAIKTEQTIATLTGNTAFPAPNPPLVFVQSKLADYRAALASFGPTRALEVKNTRKRLCHALEQLARNLEMIPGVTDSQLACTGFDIRKAPTRRDLPVDAPNNVRLKWTGTSGQVQLACKPVGRAKAYQAQYALDSNTDSWADGGIFPNTRCITISGLQRGKDYWARIRAIGPTGPGPWSEPATIMVI